MTHPVWWERFIDRIEKLKVLIPQAIEDGVQDVEINSTSLDHAMAFAMRLADVEQPGTFVQFDGMIRLVWQSGGVEGVCQFREQVAIKFLENGRAEFILFRLEGGEMGTSYITGTSHADAVLGIVESVGLRHVLDRPKKRKS